MEKGSPGFLLKVLGRGAEGRVALSDLEASEDESKPEGSPSAPPPPPPGKGKEVDLGPSRRRKRVRRRRHRRRWPNGFMAAAHRSPPTSRSVSPAAHPARARGAPDADGFFAVQSRRFGRSRTPPRPPLPVPRRAPGALLRLSSGWPRQGALPQPREMLQLRGGEAPRRGLPLPDVLGCYRGQAQPLPPAAGWRRMVFCRSSPAGSRRRRPSSADTVSGGSASTPSPTSTPLPPPPPGPPPPSAERVEVPEDAPAGGAPLRHAGGDSSGRAEAPVDGCVEPANVPPLPQAGDGPQPPPAVE